MTDRFAVEDRQGTRVFQAPRQFWLIRDSTITMSPFTVVKRDYFTELTSTGISRREDIHGRLICPRASTLTEAGQASPDGLGMYKKSKRHFSAGPVDIQPHETDLWDQMGDIAPHSLVLPNLLDWGADTISRSRQQGSDFNAQCLLRFKPQWHQVMSYSQANGPQANGGGYEGIDQR